MQNKNKKDLPSTTFLSTQKSSAGFTLIELLIVIAIIAIIAAIIFVALDPLRRFQDSRDSVRWQTVSQINEAIALYQIDNGGYYFTEIDDLVEDRVYMIVDDSYISGCDDANAYCTSGVYADNYCADLSDLVDGGYLSEIPSSPNGDFDWNDSDRLTGYTIEKTPEGSIWIRSCENENSTEIYSAR